MKCSNCNIKRFKAMDKILKIKRTWQKVQAFGKQSGEYKGKFTFCTDDCRDDYFIKQGYSVD